MKVLDEEPYGWFPLEDEGTLYLDAYCSHSFVDYDFLIALNEAELSSFKKEGRAYLSKLAYEIHFSAPAVINSRSPFKSRNLTPTYGDGVQSAVAEWRKLPSG